MEDYTPLYILTWNPDKFDWKDQGYMAELVKKYGTYSITWSCRSRRPERGDRFILLMQGQGENNGVVGAGYFMCRPYVQNDTVFGSRFVHLELIYLVNPKTDEYVRTKILKERFPLQHWTPQISGIRIRSGYTPDIWKMVTTGKTERETWCG